jgi:microcystin-dependent protein
MSEPFIAEIRIFAGNFAPRGWAFCNGQLLPIAQNTALFSLIGTTYGGDGRTTTALPNLQERAAMHPGRGPGLTARRLGEQVGVTEVTLTEGQMPAHTHSQTAFPGSRRGRGNSNEASGNQISRAQSGVHYSGTGDTAMAGSQISSTGGGQAHNNLQPYLALNYIIALVGLYPSRS